MSTVQSRYVTTKRQAPLPRLPLEGSIDLTYRCNNNCRHCWVRIPANAPEMADELTFDEIRRIADEARAMGCRKWNISGGEPMLRPDFPEIFDYLTSRAAAYSLNTNGTLITPATAQLLKRKGAKMVALYGATAEVCDDVTRTPGSFERTMQGIAYLKEAGAGFIVQLVPMRANWHQWGEMIALAKALSPHWRVGASWLYLSASGSPERNAEIAAQRLDPKDVVALDPPNLIGHTVPGHHSAGEAAGCDCATSPTDDRLFASCIANRRDFHIDPFGKTTFCCFVKDPALRFDLHQGSFGEFWDEFFPSLADKVRGATEWLEHCGTCQRRSDCNWCAVYGYLERSCHSAPVLYLCNVSQEVSAYKSAWERDHRRYYRIAGITIRVESDLHFTEETFNAKFQPFRVDGPGEDTVTIRHHFEIPNLPSRDLGQEVYRTPPWAISRRGDSWIYRQIGPDLKDQSPYQLAVFNTRHERGEIYHLSGEAFTQGNLESLTMFPTDQILLARLLADRRGCILHACGAILEGQGLLFVGHSGAGKTTMVSMLRGRAEILCDDRIAIRRESSGFTIHGTWSHGEAPDVSPGTAPLGAVLFLRKAGENRITRIANHREILGRLLSCLIKPLASRDWWIPTLDALEGLSWETACYDLAFDKSGAIVPLLEKLVEEGIPAAVMRT